jgi:RES domain-containing protein
MAGSIACFDRKGQPALKTAGRWHSQGRRIVYLSDHPSSALLEMLVHMDRDLIPPTDQLLRIGLPPAIALETVQLEDLPADWRTNLMASRAIRCPPDRVN